MADDDKSPLDPAEQLMQEHRFVEAIRCLQGHLETRPDDAKALLQLGICHLLNRSEDEFAAIHHRAAAVVRQLSPPPPEVSRLWTLSRSLAAKLSTTALVLSATAATGCDPKAVAPEVVPETSPTTAAATTQPETTTGAAEEATGTPSSSASTAPTTTPAATAAAPTGTPPATQTRPAHRYSGGVLPPKKITPAHRYSGGVIRD